MATFVVAHGAWSAGWAWKKMRARMAERGHVLVTPTHTGLGERAHLLNRDVDLELHIADILGVLEFEDLTDVIMIGHSYGGMVATGVADRARERVSAVIYVDAHVPRDGDSISTLTPERFERMKKLADEKGEGWKIPPTEMPDDTSDEDREWAMPRRKPQPIKAFEQPLKFHHGELTVPRIYVYCTRIRPGDHFRQYLERAREEGWDIYEMDSSHNPHINIPDELTDILDEISKAIS
jgi:pimeloyl-ACP methyl ester carboxylesterase